MAPRKQYLQTIIFPSGKTVENTHTKLRDAQIAISYALYDNGYMSKRDAQTQAMLKPGESIETNGATFRIDLVTA